MTAPCLTPLYLQPNPLRPCPAAALPLFDGRTTLWHGGSIASQAALEFGTRWKAGLHVGTRPQADHRIMRTPQWDMAPQDARPDANMYAFCLSLPAHAVAQVHDCCSFWPDLAQEARAQGVHALVYLNRFEGVRPEEVRQAMATIATWTTTTGAPARISDLTDAQAQALLPSATWSVLVLSPEAITQSSLPVTHTQAA